MGPGQGCRISRIGGHFAPILISLLGALAVGCDRLPPAAVKQIRQGHQAYQRRDYDGAQKILSPVIAQHGREPDIAEAYYVRGLALLRKNQGASARGDFEAAIKLTDRPDLKSLAHAQLGNLDFEAGNYRSAATHYGEAKDLPDRPPTDRILLRGGTAMQRNGQFKAAKRVLAELLLRFEGSQAAKDARRRLAWTGDYHSIQCGVFSTHGAAQREATQLRGRGLDASAWRETIDGSTKYVVRVGRYSRYDAALAELPRVRGQVADAFIVP